MMWPVAVVDSGTTLRQAAESLAADELGALAVLEKDTLVGVLSERDVVRHVAAGADLDETLVRDGMSTDLVTVQTDDSLGHAAQLMREAAVRHLPVLEGDLIAGFLSIRDLFDMYVESAPGE
jgi:CBS domain-containing protein